MKSLFGIYVVLTTILTMEASAYPYVPYSSQPQGYFGQKQWNTPQSDYTNQAQSSYFQQPSQDWTSRGYQPSNFESNLYNTAPASNVYHSSLGYPTLSRPSTSNSYGSSLSDPYPQQILPQQQQDIGNSDDQSKFKILHLDLPNSPNSRTIQLPINGDPSRFRIVHVNQDAATEVEPSRSTDGVSGDALNALSRVNLELERIKLNPSAYRETDYLKGNQQSPKLSTSSYTNLQPALSGTSGYLNQGGTYSNGKTYTLSNQNLGGLYSQQGVSNSDAQADVSSASGNLGAGYNNGESYPSSTQTKQSSSYTNLQPASSGISGYGNQGGTYNNGKTYALNNQNLGGLYSQQGISNSDAQADVSSASGNLGAGYNNGESYPSSTQTKQSTSSTNMQPASSGISGYGNQGGRYSNGKTYALSNQNLGGLYSQQGISNSDAQADVSSASGNLGAGYNNGESYPSSTQTKQSTSSTNMQPASSGISDYGNQGGRYSNGKTYALSNQDLSGLYSQQGVSNSGAQADVSSASGNLGAGYGESYPTSTQTKQSTIYTNLQPASSGISGYGNQGGTYNNGKTYALSNQNLGDLYSQQGISNSDAQADVSSASGNLGAGYGESYPTSTQTKQSTIYTNLQPASSGISGYGNQGGTYNNGKTYALSNQNLGDLYSQQGISNSDAQADVSSASGNLGAGFNYGESYPTSTQTKQGTSSTSIQPASSGISGYGNQGGTYGDGKAYAQSNQNLGGLYPQQGISNSDAQADVSSASGNLGAGFNYGESYPTSTQTKQGTSSTSIQPASSGISGYGNQGGTYGDGKAYAQSNQNLGGLYPQQGVINSDAPDDVTSVSGNQDAGYSNGESYPQNTLNYRNQGGALSQPGTVYRASQDTASTSSGSRSPTEAFTGDVAYPLIKDYGNQGEGYTNTKPYPNSDNNQLDSAKQDVYPKNDQIYPVNNNPQVFGNRQPIAPNNDDIYPVNSNVWKNTEKNDRLPENGKPNRGNIGNLPGSRLGNQPPISGEYLSNIGKEPAPISNIGQGQAPVTQDESPNSAKTHTPSIHHRHIPVNNPSQPSKPSLTTTAQASGTAVSHGETTRTHPTALNYRHPYYLNNSPHKRLHHSPSTHSSPNNLQATAKASSYSETQSPESNKPTNSLHIHGGPLIVHPQPSNSVSPMTYKIPIRGGPDKFRNRFTTQSPNSNRPDNMQAANGDSSKVQPGFSDQTQPQPKDSDNASAEDQNGTSNSAFAPQNSPANGGANDQQDLSDSSVPVNYGTQPGILRPEDSNAPTGDEFSGLIQSVSSLVPTDEGSSSPTEYLPSLDYDDFKNTQPEPNDSQFPTYTYPYDDGTDSTGNQPIPIGPYKPPGSTASQDDGNSSPNSKPDGTNISNPDKNIANSQKSADNPSLPSTDSVSPSKDSTSTLSGKSTTEAPKNTKDAANKSDDGVGSLVPDSLESTDSTRVSSASNPAKKPKTSTIFKRINKTKRNKKKGKLSPTSSTEPIEKPKPTSNDNLEDDSSDVGALLGLDKDTKTDQDTLESLQYLGISTDNFDIDTIDDAENSAKGTSSSASGQAQAAGSDASKADSRSACSKFRSLFSQSASEDISLYSKPLRGLIKIIATLEKLFSGTC